MMEMVMEKRNPNGDQLGEYLSLYRDVHNSILFFIGFPVLVPVFYALSCFPDRKRM